MFFCSLFFSISLCTYIHNMFFIPFILFCVHTYRGSLFCHSIQAISSFNVVNMCLPRFLQKCAKIARYICTLSILAIHNTHTETEIKTKTGRWYGAPTGKQQQKKSATCVGGKKRNGEISNSLGRFEVENKIRGDRKRTEMKWVKWSMFCVCVCVFLLLLLFYFIP